MDVILDKMTGASYHCNILYYGTDAQEKYPSTKLGVINSI